MTLEMLDPEPLSSSATPLGLWIQFTSMDSAEARMLRNYAESIQRHSRESLLGRRPLPEHLEDLTYGHPGINALNELKNGWDGYNAKKPSKAVIKKAGDVWDLTIGAFGYALPMPDVAPGASGVVAFTWKQKILYKQLELWIHDKPSFFAEWCLIRSDGSTIDGKLRKVDDLIPVLQHFLQIH